MTKGGAHNALPFVFYIPTAFKKHQHDFTNSSKRI